MEKTEKIGVYEKLEVLEELKEKIEDAVSEIWPGPVGTKNEYIVRFYTERDEDAEKERNVVGVRFEFTDDVDLTPHFQHIEKIKNATGADDIFIEVEDSIVVALELYFKEQEADA